MLMETPEVAGEMTTDAVRVGEVHTIRIENVAFGGSGVGRIQGVAVFVPFTVTGDEVEVEINSVRKRFALASVRRILHPSDSRVPPACQHFGRCGGCQL